MWEISSCKRKSRRHRRSRSCLNISGRINLERWTRRLLSAFDGKLELLVGCCFVPSGSSVLPAAADRRAMLLAPEWPFAFRPNGAQMQATLQAGGEVHVDTNSPISPTWVKLMNFHYIPCHHIQFLCLGFVYLSGKPPFCLIHPLVTCRVQIERVGLGTPQWSFGIPPLPLNKKLLATRAQTSAWLTKIHIAQPPRLY